MRIRIYVLLALAVLGYIQQASAQVAYFNISRQKWNLQLGLTPVPFAERFSVNVLGNGMLQSSIASPAVTNTLLGGEVQMSYATNIGTISMGGTNVVFNTNAFGGSFPTGQYRLTTTYRVIKTDFTKIFTGYLTNDFSLVEPVITNVTPLMSLAPVQTFTWPVFSSQPGDYVRFVLLEGNSLSTNLMQDILNNGIESVTNSTTILYWGLKLNPANNSITVSNLNPALNHLALLEFHRVNSAGGDVLIPYEVSSVSVGATFYLGLNIFAPPVSQTVEVGDVVLFNVIAAGATPISYQWYFNNSQISGATNFYYTIASAKLSDAGPYYVKVTNPAGSLDSDVAILTVTNIVSLELGDPAWISTNKAFRFTVYGQDGGSYSIEASPDLKAWTQIGSVSTPLGIGYFTNFNALTNPIQFYRAKKP